jgi:predicted Zn-dependent protease with MMP-like domain
MLVIVKTRCYINAMLSINRKEFKKIVKQAMEGLPQDIGVKIQNVALVIEEEPSAEELKDVGLDPGQDTMTGMYQGYALPERGASFGNVLPDRIVIYRKPLLEECRNKKELIREVQATVIHEVGHYFGMADKDLP